MFSSLRKIFRRAAFGGLTLGLIGFVVPTVYEARHNENQQDRIQIAENKLVQEQFFTCDPAAAGSAQDAKERAKRLTDAVNASFADLNPGWGKPLDLFSSGVKRMANGVPGTTGFFANYIKSIPGDYHSGNYTTALDDVANYTTALGNLGVGVCFDANLSKINAGSAYTRDLGIVTLNPSLSPGELAEHARRQLQRLNQELVLPYDRVVKSGNDLTSNFEERFSHLREMTALLDGAVVTLPLNTGAHDAAFAEVPRKSYNPPLLKQPPAEQDKAAPPPPADQPTGKQTTKGPGKAHGKPAAKS